MTTAVAASPRRVSLNLLGVVPFFLVAIAFLALPVSFLVIGSFQDEAGNTTLQNYRDLSTPLIVNAFRNSIEVSLVTAILGGVFGFLLAYAVILGGLPRPLRTILTTFSGVASNFAGVPLAMAFIFTLGQAGLITRLLENPGTWTFLPWCGPEDSANACGLDLYGGGFNLYSKIGIELVYLYFQFPLMVLIIGPAIEGLKRDWREAAENMGATPAQYWRHVALPILTPSILGTIILLFGNAFGAQATAYQLTGGTINLVPIVIGAQIRGDVLHNTGLGYAMAMGMVVIMAVSIAVYTWLQRIAERWLRS